LRTEQNPHHLPPKEKEGKKNLHAEGGYREKQRANSPFN